MAARCRNRGDHVDAIWLGAEGIPRPQRLLSDPNSKISVPSCSLCFCGNKFPLRALPSPLRPLFSLMKRFTGTLIRFASWLIGTVTGGFLLSRYLNYHPRPIETVEPVNTKTAPSLLPGQRIRAVTFNVQFLAGTGYHFFYDGGPDTPGGSERH